MPLPQTDFFFVSGGAGVIETAVHLPADGETPRGLVLVCSPNPLDGGTFDNKVVTTLAKAFSQAGFYAARFNYRGIGKSEGAWGGGTGELDDARRVFADCFTRYGLARDATKALAGFSFGGAIASQLAQEVAPGAMVLVAPAVGRFLVAKVAPNTLVIQGDLDDVIALDATLAWARPQKLAITVFTDCGHYFHGRLVQLKETVARYLREQARRA
jgi:alpha/beta superfamily hydrolase